MADEFKFNIDSREYRVRPRERIRYKDAGYDNVCWHCFDNLPQGGLANTYMAEEKMLVVSLGFKERKAGPGELRVGIKVVIEALHCFIWIGYYKDVNT